MLGLKLILDAGDGITGRNIPALVVNTMPADSLAHKIVRASSGMVLAA